MSFNKHLCCIYESQGLCTDWLLALWHWTKEEFPEGTWSPLRMLHESKRKSLCNNGSRFRWARARTTARSVLLVHYVPGLSSHKLGNYVLVTQYLKRWTGLARPADPARLFLPQNMWGFYLSFPSDLYQRLQMGIKLASWLYSGFQAGCPSTTPTKQRMHLTL